MKNLLQWIWRLEVKCLDVCQSAEGSIVIGQSFRLENVGFMTSYKHIYNFKRCKFFMTLCVFSQCFSWSVTVQLWARSFWCLMRNQTNRENNFHVALLPQNKWYSEEKKQQRLACVVLTRHLHPSACADLWRFACWISDVSQRDAGRAPAHCVPVLHLMRSFLLLSLFSFWYLTEFFCRWRVGQLVLWSCGKRRPGRKERERPDFPSINCTLFLSAVPASSSGHGWGGHLRPSTLL